MATQSSTTRTSVFALLDSTRQELTTSFQGLSEEQMEAPLPDGWSVKDILAHVASWEEMTLPDLWRASKGHATVLANWDDSQIDDWNRINMQIRRRFPLEQVLYELDFFRRTTLDFLNTLAAEVFTTGYIPVACMHSAGHDQRHASQIRDWRRQQGV